MTEETKRNEKIHAAQFGTVKQERQDNKSGKAYSSGVVLRREQQETTRKGTNVCNHCGRNDHQRKSSNLCPFNAGKVHSTASSGMHTMPDDQLPSVDIVPANTQENVTCASSVARLALQGRANRANQMLVSN
jgi:ribosomal protein L37AE/L43A